MYLNDLQKAYEQIYESIKNNSENLLFKKPCKHILKTMINLNIILFKYNNSRQTYIKAKLIALQDWKKAMSGIDYNTQPLLLNNYVN